MASIKNVKPGQVLFMLMKQKMGNTKLTRKALYHVSVKEVDPEGNYVIASWNGNTPKKFYSQDVAKWKVNRPTPKGTSGGLPIY